MREQTHSGVEIPRKCAGSVTNYQIDERIDQEAIHLKKRPQAHAIIMTRRFVGKRLLACLREHSALLLAPHRRKNSSAADLRDRIDQLRPQPLKILFRCICLATAPESKQDRDLFRIREKLDLIESLAEPLFALALDSLERVF